VKAEDAWQRHRQWSAAADESKKSLDQWRSRNLGVIVVGAVFGALAAQDSWFPATVTTTFGALGAAALAVAAVIQARLLGAGRVQEWVGARAASESLKSIVFQYQAGVAPFASADRESQLAAKVRDVQDRAKLLNQLMFTAKPDGRAMPTVSGIADYVVHRAQHQATWHARKVQDHQDRAKRWRAAELTATVVAAILAVVGGSLHGPDLSAWVAVATTVGAAFAAHLASSQHERIAASYASAADELQFLIDGFDAGTATPDDCASFVVDVERALATQNDGWVSLISSASR
jgi:hypothetical protein